MNRFTFVEYLFSRRWPMLLLALIGLVIALIRWKQHPKVSLLTAAGLFLFILQSLTFGTIFYFLPRLLEQGFSYGGLNNLYLFVEVIRDFVYSCVIILLVSAAFIQRPRPLIPRAFK